MSCNDCKEDLSFKSNYYQCINVLRRSKNEIVRIEEIREAVIFLSASSGIEAEQFDIENGVFYTKQAMEQSISKWEAWYNKNKCSMTMSKADSLVNSYNSVNHGPKNYYYSVTGEGNSVPHLYFVISVQESNDVRKVTQYRYYKDKNAIVDTLIEYYKVKDKELFKLRNKYDVKGDCFLSINTDTCVVYNHRDKVLNEALRTKHCFIGKQNIETESGSIETYVFNREVGKQETVISRVYFNHSFLLIKEEYIKGIYPLFERKLVSNIPDGFSRLLNLKPERVN